MGIRRYGVHTDLLPLGIYARAPTLLDVCIILLIYLANIFSLLQLQLSFSIFSSRRTLLDSLIWEIGEKLGA
jgi:hypothetical protein